MADKRTYREIVAVIETEVIHINNHLCNIDQHLEKLNTRTGDNEILLARHSERFKFIYKIGAGLLTLIGGAIALTLKILGVY